MKAKTNDIYTIFLLKKNIRSDIIKTILEYLPIVVPEILKEWKIAIISVGQEYKSIKSKHDYKTGSEITYREREIPIDIGKFKNNYNKNRKSKCFNCNIYRHIAKNCWKPKKEKKTRKYYKCYKVGHLTKNYRKNQIMKTVTKRRILLEIQSRLGITNLCT